MFYNSDVERHMADFQTVGDPHQEHVEYMIYDFLRFPIGLKLKVLMHLMRITIFSR
ncbi:MAG: hypothetical protein Kow00121_30560 [Elainellaceae cyanobacterium]